MRTFLILAVLCGTAAADCVIHPEVAGSEYNPFYGNNLVVCDIAVEWWDPVQSPDDTITPFNSRPAVLTWKPGVPGYLSIVGEGISFFDDTGGISSPELRYGGGVYGHRQDFGGIGYGYDIDFTPDPNAPMTVDGVTTSGLIQMDWTYSLTDKSHSIGSSLTEVGVRFRFGPTAVAAPAVPEPSAFLLLATVALVPAAIAWRRSHNRLH